MDALLLQMLVRSARGLLAGRRIGLARWYRPVLGIALEGADDTRYLTVILQPPGPFCFLSGIDPLEGVTASTRFTGLTGSTVVALDRPAGQRILIIDARTPGETGESLQLRALLFGSAGRVELSRPGGPVHQFVGSRLQAGKGAGGGAGDGTIEGAFYLLSGRRIGRVTPSATDDAGASFRFGPFSDAVTACEAIGQRILAEAHDRIVRSRVKPLERRIGTRRELLSKLGAELARADDHERLRREAETLAAYQSSVPKGVDSVQLPDVYDPDRRLLIALDPSLPIRVQVERRFKKAKKLSASRAHTRRRIGEVEGEIHSLERTVASVEAAPDFAAAMDVLDRAERSLPATRLPAAAGGRSAARDAGGRRAPFRRFELDDVWFVLVGRNNRENDQLTFRTASPTDLWLHAQQVPGSHVVLKCRGSPGAPPARILEAAAAIAAHFSKARHSGLVPVVYTERRYVRKFRGAKAGEVVCEREKTVMVAPAVPPSPQED